MAPAAHKEACSGGTASFAHRVHCAPHDNRSEPLLSVYECGGQLTALPCCTCSSHLDVSESDPSIGEKFSVESLRQSGRRLESVPSMLHGAPETAEVSDTTRSWLTAQDYRAWMPEKVTVHPLEPRGLTL